MLARYSPISARSIRRSSVRPNGSQRRAAQHLERRQHLERGLHPRAERPFLQLALVVFGGKGGRREVIVELEVPFEHGVDPA